MFINTFVQFKEFALDVQFLFHTRKTCSSFVQCLCNWLGQCVRAFAPDAQFLCNLCASDPHFVSCAIAVQPRWCRRGAKRIHTARSRSLRRRSSSRPHLGSRFCCETTVARCSPGLVGIAAIIIKGDKVICALEFHTIRMLCNANSTLASRLPISAVITFEKNLGRFKMSRFFWPNL